MIATLQTLTWPTSGDLARDRFSPLVFAEPRGLDHQARKDARNRAKVAFAFFSSDVGVINVIATSFL